MGLARNEISLIMSLILAIICANDKIWVDLLLDNCIHSISLLSTLFTYTIEIRLMYDRAFQSYVYFYHPLRSLGNLMFSHACLILTGGVRVFTGVSFCPGGMVSLAPYSFKGCRVSLVLCPFLPSWVPPPSRARTTHHTTPRRTMGYGRQVGGTDPTGMLSCRIVQSMFISRSCVL